MSTPLFSHEQITHETKFSPEDIEEIRKRRRDNNRLGFAYQLAFVRLTNRFPNQEPFEILEELLIYVSVQIDVPTDAIEIYKKRRPTIAEHRVAILEHLGLGRFDEKQTKMLEEFTFEEACHLEQTGPLMVKVKRFLKEARILLPADYTLNRLIVTQRQAARDYIFDRITNNLSTDLQKKLDALLASGSSRLTPFQSLKQVPDKPSPGAMSRLAEKLQLIQETGVLTVDLSWLNNNYQRSLTRYARRCSADRLRNLQAKHRYAVLPCFLWQVYRDTIDHMIDMYGKLMNGVYNRAQAEIDEQTKNQRQMIRSSLTTLHTLADAILDENISDSDLRHVLFSKVDKENLINQVTEVETWLTGKYSHVFNLVLQRFSYLRQFAPLLLQHLRFQLEEGTKSTIVQAIETLRDLRDIEKIKYPNINAGLSGTRGNVDKPFLQSGQTLYDSFISSHRLFCQLDTCFVDTFDQFNDRVITIPSHRASQAQGFFDFIE